MTAPRPSPRPRFELTTKLSPDEITARMRAFFRGTRRMRGVALDGRIELGWANEELRFWSPQLVVEVEEDGAGGARLHARFGPDPYVWGMYVLSYIALAFLTLVAIAWGIAELTLGRTPTGLYAAPGGGALAALVYGASFVGQGLGSDQMYQLRATLTEVTEAQDQEHEPAVASGAPEG